jgi:hypothetical protein
MSHLTETQRQYLAAMEIDYWELRSQKIETLENYCFDLLDVQQNSKGLLCIDAWGSTEDAAVWKLVDAMLQAIKLSRGQSFDFANTSFDSANFILIMGEKSAQRITKQQQGLDEFRQKNHSKQIVTYHPRHLLQHPEDKRKAWQDLQLLL